jgi:hypothetical protein
MLSSETGMILSELKPQHLLHEAIVPAIVTDVLVRRYYYDQEILRRSI